MNDKKTKVRDLAKVVGKLMACVKTFGPVIRLLTRFCYQDIANAPSWNSKLVLSDGTKFELSHIYNNWVEINGFAVRSPLTQYPVRFSSRQVASEFFSMKYRLQTGFCYQELLLQLSVKNLLRKMRYKFLRISIQVLKLNSS